jgi:hypothetical protein
MTCGTDNTSQDLSAANAQQQLSTDARDANPDAVGFVIVNPNSSRVIGKLFAVLDFTSC